MESSETTITDIAGNEWGVGDCIFYSTRSGSTHDMQYARVESIHPEWVQKFSGGYYNYKVKARLLASSGYLYGENKLVTLTVLDRVVKACVPGMGYAASAG